MVACRDAACDLPDVARNCRRPLSCRHGRHHGLRRRRCRAGRAVCRQRHHRPLLCPRRDVQPERGRRDHHRRAGHDDRDGDDRAGRRRGRLDLVRPSRSVRDLHRAHGRHGHQLDSVRTGAERVRRALKVRGETRMRDPVHRIRVRAVSDERAATAAGTILSALVSPGQADALAGSSDRMNWGKRFVHHQHHHIWMCVCVRNMFTTNTKKIIQIIKQLSQSFFHFIPAVFFYCQERVGFDGTTIGGNAITCRPTSFFNDLFATIINAPHMGV